MPGFYVLCTLLLLSFTLLTLGIPIAICKNVFSARGKGSADSGLVA